MGWFKQLFSSPSPRRIRLDKDELHAIRKQSIGCQWAVYLYREDTKHHPVIHSVFQSESEAKTQYDNLNIINRRYGSKVRVGYSTMSAVIEWRNHTNDRSTVYDRSTI